MYAKAPIRIEMISPTPSTSGEIESKLNAVCELIEMLFMIRFHARSADPAVVPNVGKAMNVLPMA